MPDTVPHLGVFDRYYDPLGAIQDMSIISCSGRKANVTGLGLDGLPVGIGFEVTCVILCAVFLVANLVAIRIVHFSFHVTPRIVGLPTEAKPSKSYSA